MDVRKLSKKNCVLASSCFFLILAGLLGWYALFIFTPSKGTGSVTVTIPQGAGVRQIGLLLAEKKLLTNDLRYLVYVRLSGLGSRLKAGEYSFPYGLTPSEVLRKIARGEVVLHPVTIVEGMNIEQIASLFAQGNWVDSKRFLNLCQDKQFIQELGLDMPSLEGYLFPDTYYMVKGMDEKKLIRWMVQRFNTVWSTLPPLTDTSLNKNKVVTLASIVEKETGQEQERPLIARVFLNRLKLGMPLQSDPTVIYGLGKDYDGNLHKADLQKATLYNTYVIPALPPGPICNPGKAALLAVLQPTPSKALYFVAKNDGFHFFSATLAEHNRAVNLYQKSKVKDQSAIEKKLPLKEMPAQ